MQKKTISYNSEGNNDWGKGRVKEGDAHSKLINMKCEERERRVIEVLCSLFGLRHELHLGRGS